MSTNSPPESTDLCSKLDNRPPPAKRNPSRDANGNTMNKDSNLLQKINSTANVNSARNQKKIDILMAKIPENNDIIDDDTKM